MPRPPTPVLAGLVLGLTLVGSATAAGSLSVDPTPVPAEGTAQVTATFERPVESASIVACQAEANRTVSACFRAVEMEADGDGNWTATVPPGGRFGSAPLVGVNATGRTADGDAVHLPGDGAQYRFVAVAEASTEGAPGPGVGAVIAAVAGAAAAWRLGRA